MISHEVYWQVPALLKALHYILFVFAAVIFTLGIFRRYNLWRIGQSDNRFNNYPVRIWRVIVYALFHRRILSEAFGGLVHSFIFYGFGLLYIGTLIVLVQADFGIIFLEGNFYRGFSLAMDIAGLALLSGLILAFTRRFIIGSSNLDKTIPDAFSVFLIFCIAALGFLMEGLRINVTALAQGGEVLKWAPIGTVVARLWGFAGMSEEGLVSVYPMLWFIHSTLTLVFIAYIPYSKLWHIFTGPLSIFFSDLKHRGVLNTPDLEKAETFGVSTIKEFPWKNLVDLDACMRCGRCRANCPTDLSEKPLSPKKLIRDLRNHLDTINPNNKTQEFKPIPANVITEDTIWACTTCKYCQEHCPVFIEHVDKIVELRRNLVLSESRFPAELKSVFKNLETNGNPWAVGWDKRTNWAQGLNVRILSESPSDKTDYLFWVGCAGATDERNIKVARAFVNILQKAGVDFAILGNEEKCCGDSARRLGNEYLYQSIVQENMEILKKYQFNKIITLCPHCLNTIGNEYNVFPVGGGSKMKLSVIHHTQLLNQLISEGKLKLSGKIDKVVTYHDSCYLGRYNEIYSEPRSVLKSIGSIRLKEMKRNHVDSFCCGAGGGRMWMEEKLGKRINQIRTEEAAKTGADMIATACPYCLTMLEDGIKEKDLTAKMKARDIIELVNDAIQ
ncbi:MAG: 4Fe-4S dicluster domain-containing protein [Planctomycetes bacterium]|nr:4Fe-4S dicluster domain-containing protein [Planctomycetota bacterium]